MLKKIVFFLMISVSLLTAHAKNLRLVSLSPAITESLIAVGAGDALVGVTDDSFKNSAIETIVEKIPIIGTFSNPDINKIIPLHPDLVLTQNYPGSFDVFNETILTPLQNAGIPVLIMPGNHLRMIPLMLYRLGKLVGNTQLGVKAANAWVTEIRDYQHKYPHGHPVLIAIRIHANPDWYVTNQSFVSEIFGICDGVNVLKDPNKSYINISTADILTKKPNIIFDLTNSDPKDLKMKNAIIYNLDPDIFLRYGPRTANAIGLACYKLNYLKK